MTNETCPDRVHCNHYTRSGRCDGCGHAHIDYDFLAENPIQKATDAWMNEPLPKASYINVGRSNGKTDVLDALKYAMEPLSKLNIRPDITNVKFNPPATIVFWSDNTKTVVKAQDDEPFDPEKGLAMAMVKKYLGNKGNYFNEISKWTKEYVDPKDFLGLGNKVAEGFEKAMNDAGKFASTTSESLSGLSERIREILYKEDTFTPMPIVIETGADLIETINNLNEIIVRYGHATVQDYYDLVGYDNCSEDCSKYGWTKDPIFTATIKKEGYCLRLSEAKLLKGEEK